MRPRTDPLPRLVHRAGAGAPSDGRLAGPGFLPVMRGTHVPAPVDLTYELRLVAARERLPDAAVFSGPSALWIHGVDHLRADGPIEVSSPHGARVRSRPGLAVRARNLAPDDVVAGPWGPVTSVARTAYDVGRHPSRYRSVPELDALAAATGVTADDVLAVAARNRGARWIRQLPAALDLMDGRAESVRESQLRVVAESYGLPRLEPQVVLRDAAGTFVARLDLAWRRLRAALEYDGAYHDDPAQFAKDRARINRITACGWRVLVVDRHLFADHDALERAVRHLHAQAVEEAGLRDRRG
ncbi:hypothetical protein [Cellulomonas sp. PhB143]|uniref:hypothetical protein n=1 Tax=Cellulomonas sp. PhB143 TaxID=2485186 RepID=UPI000F478945|nr:hypothetical protein [Cellulomonas sp. PhB143]ROS78528.1 hypothetical protein EDF32_0425 [Cellulomonas sp. PhB143]